MMLYYHREVEPLGEIYASGNIPICISRSGKMVIFAPIDFGCWNDRAEAVFKDLDALPIAQKATEKHFYSAGALTPLAQQNLAKLGYHVTENVLQK